MRADGKWRTGADPTYTVDPQQMNIFHGKWPKIFVTQAKPNYEKEAYVTLFLPLFLIICLQKGRTNIYL